MKIYRGKKKVRPINIKPMGLPKRKLSRRLSKPHVCPLKGGPMHGGWRYTRTYVDSLIITVKGETGFYMVSGEWIPCSPLGDPLWSREQSHKHYANQV